MSCSLSGGKRKLYFSPLAALATLKMQEMEGRSGWGGRRMQQPELGTARLLCRPSPVPDGEPQNEGELVV